VAYNALPDKSSDLQQASPQDMLQEGYAPQWGPTGRDDLQSMKLLGANAVRLYHSMGVEGLHDHGRFLDYAHHLGLNVFPGMHTYMKCPDHDCYASWKQAVKTALKVGFQKNGSWHPGVSTIILMNEPDFTPCSGESWCRVKRSLSALEGLLDAEKEMNVKPGRVKLTITWSSTVRTSIDGKVKGPGYFGFQDMVAGTSDPSLAHYTPRSSQAELAAAFKDRWVHSMNTAMPWDEVKSLVAPHYGQFLPHEWFIGEYGAYGQTQAAIQNDLKSMNEFGNSNAGFLGTVVFQFQAAYQKGGQELNFGLFSLGDEVTANTDKVCSRDVNTGLQTCSSYPVYCLDAHLPWFTEKPNLNYRAEAVARAWGGSAENPGRCSSGSFLTV